jgi:hypothetical protein
MGLPTPTRVWQYNVNQAKGAGGGGGTWPTDARTIMRAIVDSLLGFSSSPWTVDHSCDSVTAGTPGDGVNRWSADNKLVWQTNSAPRSWIVLKQTGILSTLQLLISLEANDANVEGDRVTCAYSIGGLFTGGTTTARPTATDECVFENSSHWCNRNSGTNTGMACRLHAMMSTDGKSTRVIMCFGGIDVSLFLFDVVENGTSGWQTPTIVAAFHGAGDDPSPTELLTYTRWVRTASLVTQVSSSLVAACYLTCEGFNGDELANQINVPNDLTGEYPIMPLGIASKVVGFRGRHAVITDLWCGLPVNATPTGYPSDASRQFMQFGRFVFKWNGSVALVT